MNKATFTIESNPSRKYETFNSILFLEIMVQSQSWSPQVKRDMIFIDKNAGHKI